MRRTLWPMAACVAMSCGYPPIDPVAAPFGLDSRPSNLTCRAPKRPVLDTGVRLERQWTGVAFDQPIFLTQAPGDDDTWYVVERDGTVRAFPGSATSGAQTRVFASVPVNASGEGGLLSMAFHPQWPATPEAYLSYTRNVATGDPSPQCPASPTSVFTSVVARFRSTNNGDSLDVGPDEILKIGQPYANHNGGHIAFGPDGMLYFGVGDGGSGNDPCNSGQNLGSLLGKVLRLDVNAPLGMYKTPTDNPYVGVASTRGEIWASGVRNPWRWSFDRESGDLWLGDVGQNTWEEIDRVVKGGNYGWRICEGLHRRGVDPPVPCNTPGMIDPVVEHARTDAQSITGGYVYRGTAMPSLVGTYLYGDYVTGNIWALTYDADNKPTPRLIATVNGSLVSFAQGNDGEVYTVQISGAISKLVPSGPQPADTFPQLLSQTGCVDPDNPTRPAPGMIPYEVNSPLWSDGADKKRYFAIPDDATIAINAEQDWVLPIGSVAMKTFLVGGTPVETRLFMRHDDGAWAGYTYEWNDSGSDATLLPASKLKPLSATAAWAYPSRNQCLQCHSVAAGGTLGLETAQLNRDAVYPSTNRQSNQLATLEHIGMLAAPLAQPPAEAPRLADPASTDPLDARARSYLHANCSHCHRPMGGGQGTMDLRYGLSLADTRTCDADNTQGTVSSATKLVVPGEPQSSILSLRMHATDAKRMPPVSVTLIDAAGTNVVDDWIGSLSACP